MNRTDIEREIIELHEFFEGWFTGSLEQTDEQFSRVSAVLADGFVLVSPGGDLDEREPLLEGSRSAYDGRPSDFRIWIEDVEVRHSRGDVTVVTYEEWQQSGDDEPTCRLSTVVFAEAQRTPNGVEWLHVHEVWRQA